MPDRKLPRAVAAIAVVGFLTGCVEAEYQEFAVTGASPSPAGTVFRTSDPNLTDAQAHDYCAGGYEKLSEQTMPTDSGTIQVWRVRCEPQAVFPFIF
jgi:hypothetical protein